VQRIAPDQEDGTLRAQNSETNSASGSSSNIATNGWHRDPAKASKRYLSGWPRTWIRSATLFLVSTALLFWILRSEVTALVDVWKSSETFGHGFFILPIVLFLFYRMHERLFVLEPKCAPWAIILVVGLSLSWMIGDLTNIMITKQFAFVALWQSLFLLIFGWRVFRAALFPLAYLYFAVPFGVSIIPTLQDITAQIVVHLLRLTGIPVFNDGYHIEIPSGNFLIAEACSGVRYLIVCIALGMLTANLFFHSWRRRLLFVGLAALVPIVANGVRAYGIVMIAHLSDYTIAVDVDHVVYGFVFLGVVLLSLLGLGALLRESSHSFLADIRVEHVDGPVPSNRVGEASYFRQLIGAGIAMAMIFSAEIVATRAKAPPSSLSVRLIGPDVALPWKHERADAPLWIPAFQGVDAELQQTYRRGDQRLDLHVAYFSYQREGAEVISDLNTVAGRESEWKVLRSSRAIVQVGGRALPITGLVIRRQNRTLLVWSWYRIGGEDTNSRLVGKFLEVKSLATGHGRSAAMIAISTELAEDGDQASALLQDFLQRVLDKGGQLYQAEAL
jgi:exosortase A